jgi:hypothetical protein
MALHIRLPGCMVILVVIGAITTLVTGSPNWLVMAPVIVIVLAILVALLPIKRKVSPERLADELEAHLLGTEGPWDWDDTTSIAIADPRLRRLQASLHKLDSLLLEEHRDELKEIIAALRRGEIPDVTPE